MEPELTFGEALECLKQGKRVYRKGWNGKGMYLYNTVMKLHYPPTPECEGWKEDAFGKSEFIVIKTADNKLIPWVASQTDSLANDWKVL